MVYLFSLLTISAFLLGQRISKKLRSNLLNPFLIALILIILVIEIGKVPYQSYYQGNFPLNNLLGVSVIALALPFYEQLPQIRKKWKPIAFGASKGIVAAILPKSVSTPIAIAIVEELGGKSAISAVGVLLAGLLGSVLGFSILHWLGVRNVRAIGLTMGSVSHALGTGRCMEYSVKTGSYSSIALVGCGVLSSILAPIVFKLAVIFFY